MPIAPPIPPRTRTIHPFGRVNASKRPMSPPATKNAIQARRCASKDTAASGRRRAPPGKGLTRCGGKLSTPRLKSIESLLMFVAAWRNTTPIAVSAKPAVSNVPARRHAIAVPSATPTRDATKLCGCVALNHVRHVAILFPDRLVPREDADLDERQRTRARVDDRVRLPLEETRDGPCADFVRGAVGDDLASALNDVEDLRVPVAVRRRLHAGLHAGDAHQHEIAVPGPHDLLVHYPRADPFLPRLLREVPHDRAFAAHDRVHRLPEDEDTGGLYLAE